METILKLRIDEGSTIIARLVELIDSRGNEMGRFISHGLEYAKQLQTGVELFVVD